MNLLGILGILTREERRSGTLIAVLSAVCALLEALSIGAVFPLVSMLLDHGKLSQFADWLQRVSAIPSPLVSEKVLIGAFAVLLLVKNVVVILVTRYKSARIYDLQTRLSAELVREFMLDRLQMVRAISGGQKISLAVTECQQLMLNTVTPCLTLIAEMATLLAVIIVLFVAAPLTTLALGAYFALVLGLFNAFTRKRVVGWGVARKESDRARQEIIKNVIESRPEIVGMGLVESVLAKYGPVNAMSSSASAHKSFMGEASKNMLEIGFLGSLGILAVLAVNVERSEMMAIAVLFVGAAYRLMPSINRILVGMHSWKFGIATLEMLLLFHRQRREWAREHPSAPEPIHDAGLRAIEIESLSFACPMLTVGAEQVPVLKDVKLGFRRGELVAIVGASGSGKTTLVQAILDNEAFPGAETVFNGGRRLLPGSRLYERIAYVSQRPLIVNGTVRDNLYIGMEGRGHSPSAAFPAFLMDGQPGVLGGDPVAVLDNRVEIGSISGGQAQRIALARAIVREPDVLVLDEPTSALNESYRSELVAHLRRIVPDAIVIMITHDRSIASGCDRILEIGNLTIMEDTEKTR